MDTLQLYFVYVDRYYVTSIIIIMQQLYHVMGPKFEGRCGGWWCVIVTPHVLAENLQQQLNQTFPLLLLFCNNYPFRTNTIQRRRARKQGAG